MSSDNQRPATPPSEPDPDSSPFRIGAISGIPFDDESEEAQAIERIIAQADRERVEHASPDAWRSRLTPAAP